MFGKRRCGVKVFVSGFVIVVAVTFSMVSCSLGGDAQAGEIDKTFKVRGLGGAGGMFVPSVSPYDSDFMMVACDMSGSYRSLDGGKTWELIHYLQMGNNRNSAWPAYFKDRVFWNRGDELRVSDDKAATWKKIEAKPWGKNAGIKYLIPVSGKPDMLLVSCKKGVWRTEDNGRTWRKVIDGETTDFAILGDMLYTVAEKSRLFVSNDLGKTWEKTEIEACNGEKVFGFAGGKDKNGSVLIASAWKIGVLRSTDEGKTWKVVVDKYQDQNNIQMAANQTKIVYAAINNGAGWCKTAWVSHDAGKTWKSAFRMTGAEKNVKVSWVQTQLKWGYYITRNGFYASRSDPNLAILSTQGDFYITRDGGKTWQQSMNEILGVKAGDPETRYRCTGLEVTSCWSYLWNPWKKNREYIAYTDIGFARTVDNGKTWSWGGRGARWTNTFYDVIFDPAVKGKMYAASSGRHDIPHWTHISPNNPKSRSHKGGVNISLDHGVTWKPLLKVGLPDLPCTSICIDPASPKAKRTLWVTIFGEGVYKSIDGGESWSKKSNGLGNPGNMHVYRIRRHPQTGNLFCLITACRIGGRSFPVPGGIWKSTDGSENWTDITKGQGIVWSTNLAVDKDDENVIYMTTATAPGKKQGGIFKTTDGGKTWKHILTDAMLAVSGGSGYDHVMSVIIHPDDKNLVYAGTNAHGLWYSKDAGKTWNWYREFPFRNVQSIQVHPKDHHKLYLTTFGGGVWVGPHLPKQ